MLTNVTNVTNVVLLKVIIYYYYIMQNIYLSHTLVTNKDKANIHVLNSSQC